jgi:hypothetical protein
MVIIVWKALQRMHALGFVNCVMYFAGLGGRGTAEYIGKGHLSYTSRLLLANGGNLQFIDITGETTIRQGHPFLYQLVPLSWLTCHI